MFENILMFLCTAVKILFLLMLMLTPNKMYFEAISDRGSLNRHSTHNFLKSITCVKEKYIDLEILN